MTSETDLLDGLTMPVGEMATTLGLRPRRVQQLVEMGVIPAPDRGRYPVAAAVQGYIRFLSDQGRQEGTASKPNAYQEARVREIEGNIARRNERLKADALAACMTVIDAAAGGLKADLLSIPARVTKDLPLRRRIEDGITAALNAGSRRAATEAKRDADR